MIEDEQVIKINTEKSHTMSADNKLMPGDKFLSDTFLILFSMVVQLGRAYDFSFFNCSNPFYFLLIEFCCNISLS